MSPNEELTYLRALNSNQYLMIPMKFRTLVVLCFIYIGCSSSKNVASQTSTLHAYALHPFGRVLLNNDKHIELISSGAHVGFSFVGTKCQVYAYITHTTGHNYLQYELDGVYQKRIKISGDQKQSFVIQASGNGIHTVWLYKATEAHTGPIFVEKVTGTGLKPLESSSLPLIEFIGNSITCGAAADPSEVPCGAGDYHDQHNAYQAYGPRVARALNTNFILSSVSGIGITGIGTAMVQR